MARTVGLPMPRPRDAEVALDFPREWIELIDPGDSAHLVKADLTWLLSRWSCIYGNGCHGVVEGGAAHGCCTHGAFFTDTDDIERVESYVARLGPGDWQFYRPGGHEAWTERDSVGDEEDRLRTAVVDGACLFHNREGFPAGAGCALHALALRSGQHPLETKPDVCWQLPIRREQEWVTRTDGTVVLVDTISEFDRRGWGEGGHDLHWWCTSAPEAHRDVEPLYRTYGPELIALLGDDAYAELARLCAAREARGLIAPHPATVEASRLAGE